MGLIKAVLGSVSGTLSDQWKEYFYCEAMPNALLVTKGKKKQNGRTSNTHGDENIISNGSIIAVATGQCAIITDGGKVIELVAEEGEFRWDTSTEPSIMSGGLKDLSKTFDTIGKRFTFGGDVAGDQRIFYVNTKEIIDNKFGSPTPIPYHIVDKNIGLDADFDIRVNGLYSFKITDPIKFYTNVCGNISSDYTKDVILEQMRTEFVSSLQVGLAKIGASGMRPSELPSYANEIGEAMDSALSSKWSELRGIDVVSVAFNPITLSDSDALRLKNLQEAGALRDPGLAAGMLTKSQAAAMEAAASNSSGAMTGFMGMGMAQNANNQNISNLFAMGQNNNSINATNSWTCECGKVNNGNFCTECGKKKPSAMWTCSCGQVNSGNFCMNCGAKKNI